LAGAGRDVTVLERDSGPGGRAGSFGFGGYEFDTGPTVLTMPTLIDEAMNAVGEKLADWVDLVPLEPAYRAYYPDGSTLDVITEPARMAEHIATTVSAREADGYQRFVAYVSRLWQIQRDSFIARNYDSPRDLLRLDLIRLVAAGGFGRLDRKIGQFFQDPRTRRAFSFQSLYAGVAPHQALALYAVISYLDTVAGVWFPRGGIHAIPVAMAGAAEKHGVTIHYDAAVTRVETLGDRATAVITAAGERYPADAVILNPDLPIAYRDLLPDKPPRRLERLRQSPSAVVMHIGSRHAYTRIAHHNIHFGGAWRRTFDEVISGGLLMSDPSLLVTNPTRTDPTRAPQGRQTYYVLAPVPNLSHLRVDWRDGLGQRYAGELVATLEARGYLDFGAGIEVSRVVTPADWVSAGLAAGTPFASAHTFGQTGPFRPSNLHPRIRNVVFVGSGTQPGVGVPMVVISGKLAAQRVVGAGPDTGGR
jgi:phytoene desaturase